MPFLFNTNDIVPTEHKNLGELFHEASKLHKHASASLGKWINGLQENPVALQSMASSYKTYPHKKQTKLPLNDTLPTKSIVDIITQRRSVFPKGDTPIFSSVPINIKQISIMLQNSYGITGEHRVSVHGVPITQKLRATPSGGALYPLEIYPIILKECEIQSGIYHYNVTTHSLELLKANILSEQVAAICSNQSIIAQASVAFIITSVFARSYFKYKERGYRFVLLEAGHLMENIYLLTTAMDLGIVAIGGFFDDDVNNLINIDGVNEAVVYMCAIGNLNLR